MRIQTYFLMVCVWNMFQALHGSIGPAIAPHAIQLYEVSLYNDTDLALDVSDEINGPTGALQKKFALAAKQTLTYAWPQTLGSVQSRKITIQGSCQGVSGRTNAIIIGNTRDATFVPGGFAPGGLYIIGKPAACTLTVWQKPAHDTEPVLFPRGVQMWDVTIENKTKIDLWVVDEISTVERLYKRTNYNVPKGSQITIQARTDITFVKTRRIIIQGSCQGVSGKTNTLIIGNTPDSTFAPLGGSPGGNYVIVNNGCTISLATTYAVAY